MKHPGIGPVDLHLFGEGTHRRLWEMLGVHPHDGGAHVAVWAPNARGVQVLGDHNGWTGGVDVLEPLDGSGVWEGWVDGMEPGQNYAFEVQLHDGRWVQRRDPMARRAEVPPRTASVVDASDFRWTDPDWEATRAERNGGRMAVYELHAGSWRHGPDGKPLGFRALAEPLVEHVVRLGFTHVELMPPATHPFGGSWGYQVTGYYAPDARGGSPDDLRYLVDALHRAGIGVLVDWVPAHFPRDEGGLARFDGGPLYEHWDPRKGEHPDWGTLVFDHGRNQVRNFLVANALYWLDEFRVDGLRVDAVASMLYLDYSRGEGQWEPNRHGGRENLEAVAFVRELCDVVHDEHPGALVIAEESTAWPGVTKPTSEGGLGFDRKWNMGWMHDTLGFLQRDPVHRRYHHHEMTFPMHYAFDERWVLPLSHDEVVHGKGALVAKFPGDHWQRRATLRLLYAWQWCSPGAPLVFMGGELGQEREWADHRELDWWLADDPDHAGISRLIADLNRLVARQGALWRGDEDRECSWWLDAGDAESSVFSLARRDPTTGEIVLIVLNATPVPRHGYRLGVPFDGRWCEVLSTDDLRYGGSGLLAGTADADMATPWQGQPGSILVTLPPLGASIWVLDEERGTPPPDPEKAEAVPEEAGEDARILNG